jgi:hypothetical protein
MQYLNANAMLQQNLFCVGYDLCVDIIWDLSDECQCYLLDHLSLQRWEGSKDFGGTFTVLVKLQWDLRMLCLPWRAQYRVPEDHQLRYNTQDVEMCAVSKEKVPKT